MDMTNTSEVPKSAFTCLHSERVRFSEIDGQSIVFNAHYLTYADIGITEYFRALGEGQPGPFFYQYGGDIYAVHASIDYHASAMLDDVIEIATRISKIGRTSLSFHIAIFRGKDRLTDISVVYALRSLDTGSALPIPAGFIADVRSYQSDPPEMARVQT
jgi:acyl-CoA thioester hydrolase